jgi:hypothetical protein
VSGLGVEITRPVGFVEFDGVWLDDRRRCTWALCDVSFVACPGTTVALVAPDDQGSAEGVVDLLAGRRLPIRGRVGIDGVDLRDLDRISHLRALTAEHLLDTGEQRLTVAGRTTLVAHPTDETVQHADLVLRFDGGFVDDRERLVAQAG